MFNLLQENTYVVSDETKECVIIDCGAYYDEERDAIINYIKDNELKPMHLLCTHGHFDHNFGIDTIHDNYGLIPEIAPEDGDMVCHISEQFKSMIGVPLKREYPGQVKFFGNDEVIRFGNHALRTIHTPGHTPGSVFFYCEEEGFALSGDTLFYKGIGRWDFPEGSKDDLYASLKYITDLLPDETVIYPGHDIMTTIGYEKTNNPYLIRRVLCDRF